MSIMVFHSIRDNRDNFHVIQEIVQTIEKFQVQCNTCIFEVFANDCGNPMTSKMVD